MSDCDIFVVSVRCGGQKLLSKTALPVPKGSTFEQLYDMCCAKLKLSNFRSLTLNIDMIASVLVKTGINTPDEDGIEVLVDMKCETATELGCKFVEFILNPNSASGDPHESGPVKHTKDAFKMLMSRTYSLPPKIESEKLISPQILYNDILDWAQSLDCGWSKDSMESGIFVISTLQNALWYVDHCHDKFQTNSCALPEVFAKFQGYNQYMKHHHKAPTVTSQKLEEICNELAKAVSFPSMNTTRNRKLCNFMDGLLDSLTKYKERLDKDNKRHKLDYQSRGRDELHEISTNCLFIPQKLVVVEPYVDLDKEMQGKSDYDYIALDDHTPAVRYQRRKYIKELGLSKPIMLLRMAYGGSIGTLNFIWSVPNEDTVHTPDRLTQNAIIIKTIADLLPKFSTRAMRRDFITKYVKHVESPKSVLRHMFYELTGYDPSFENKKQEEIDHRTAQVLLESEDPELLLDLRALNRKDIDTHFGIFWDEMGKYFEEQLLAVQERRHGQELYMPLAISIEDLGNQVEKRVPPGTAIPCNETIRLQFMPGNPMHKTAMHYTGRFNVKFRVQTRQSRVQHQDSRYVAMLYHYLKEFCVKFRDYTTFVCLDDKAVVPIGEPGVPIATGVGCDISFLEKKSHHFWEYQR